MPVPEKVLFLKYRKKNSPKKCGFLQTQFFFLTFALPEENLFEKDR